MLTDILLCNDWCFL